MVLQEVGTTKRVEELKRKRRGMFFDDMFHDRRNVFFRVCQEDFGEPKIIRKAKALAVFLQEKRIFLGEDDLLAGYQQDYDYTEPANEPTIYKPFLNRVEDSAVLKEFDKAIRIGLFGSSLGGHVIPDYDGFLQKGFGAIRDEAERRLVNEDDVDRDFLAAVIIVTNGAEVYIRRYARRARELAWTAGNLGYKKELDSISRACNWIATNPPRSFFEALQLFWLVHEIITIEQPSGSLSLGRFDQYMFPFYCRDLKEGRITREEALELVMVLWIKFNGLWRGFQNITIGGQKADGTDATNELSHICLEATENLRQPQPAISLRLNSKTPDNLLKKACGILSKGGGLPALFNDDVIMRAKMRVGIASEDAWNYGLIGCVEPAVPGKEWSHTEALRINWAKVLELIMNEGECMISKERMNIDIKNFSEFSSFEEFYSFFKSVLSYFIELGVKALNIIDGNFYSSCPYPFLSTIMDGCIEKGKEVTAGGSRYNLTSINGCGMANTVDSLASIRRLVYEEKVISLQDLREALFRNFEKMELLRQRLISRIPKFGNDDDYVDTLMKDLAEYFCNSIMRYRNPRGGIFQAGLYTVDWHEVIGKLTGALADGRMATISLANGLSPSQGRDRKGPTAVMRSITKLDHSVMANGMVLDMKFNPSYFSGGEGLGNLENLIRTYFAMGGMEIQFNVVDKETLAKAQTHPESYGDLVVRVSGFSAYFTRLSRELQNEIMARSEYS